jgi:hypothetical protein
MTVGRKRFLHRAEHINEGIGKVDDWSFFKDLQVLHSSPIIDPRHSIARTAGQLMDVLMEECLVCRSDGA